MKLVLLIRKGGKETCTDTKRFEELQILPQQLLRIDLKINIAADFTAHFTTISRIYLGIHDNGFCTTYSMAVSADGLMDRFHGSN